MYDVAIKWWGMIISAFTLVHWISWWTADGYVRENKKVVLRSPIIKKILGFSMWVTEADRFSIILNIKNEIVGISLSIVQRCDVK